MSEEKMDEETMDGIGTLVHTALQTATLHMTLVERLAVAMVGDEDGTSPEEMLLMDGAVMATEALMASSVGGGERTAVEEFDELMARLLKDEGKEQA